ncbi:O-antigen ligase family protein [Asticcacaulis sp. W401b]|uniref:O-antigen ligase family protein n=1 Tax=Asticcacaulis sp. W401b TaxID=3388666 RepID=UPI003970F106
MNKVFVTQEKMNMNNIIYSSEPRFRLTGRLVGYMDTLIILSYIIGVEQTTFHFGVILLKIFLASIFYKKIHIPRNALFFVFVVFFSILPGIVINGEDYLQLIQILGFSGQLILSCALIGKDGLLDYLKSIAISVSTFAVIHSVMCIFNYIPNNYGRYFYFRGFHPNLGSEIGAIGVVAAALSMRWKSTAMIVAAIVPSIMLMQGRAALLAVVLTLALRFGFEGVAYMFRLRARAFPVLPTVVFLISLALLASSLIYHVMSDVFMLNDEYRGVGTGFVGRDSHWLTAIAVIQEKPLFGAGPGYFNQRGMLSPHNFFLYGISTMGIIGFGVFLANLTFLYVKMWSASKFHGFVLAGILPLFLFNDRMLNVNPYPFVVFVVLVSFNMNVSFRRERTGFE